MAETVLMIVGAFLIFVVAVAIAVAVVFFVSAALFLRQVRKRILEPVLKMAGIGIGSALDRLVERKQINKKD